MSERNSEQLERELESARAQLALQEAEIARLRSEVDDVRLGRAVRQLFIAAGTMDAVLPQEERPELLTLVVRMAAQLVSARSASLLVIDQTARQLVFEAATGSKADEILKFRVPLGYGIAGAVAATGEPMAIASPETNPQFAADIAQSVGHIPQSILCVPMRYADEIIGVLETLDKENGAPFTSGDIEALAQYAGIAAQMVEYVRRSDYLRAALVEIVGALTREGPAASQREQLLDGIDSLLNDIRGAPEYKAALEIAQAIGEIVRSGEAERALCYDWLKRMQSYVRSRTSPLHGSGLWSL